MCLPADCWSHLSSRKAPRKDPCLSCSHWIPGGQHHAWHNMLPSINNWRRKEFTSKVHSPGLTSLPQRPGDRWVLMKRGRSFQKTKSAATIWPSNYAPGLLAQRNGNLCSHKNLCVNVHGVFICLSPNLEAAQILLGRWMVKLTLGISVAQKQQKGMNYFKRPGWIFRVMPSGKKNPISKGYIRYDSIYITVSKW